MKHPFAKSTLFARLRAVVAWPCALVLAAALLLGGIQAVDGSAPDPSAGSTAAVVHCAGEDGANDPAGDMDCCGTACACVLSHAISPLPGAMARHAYGPACPATAAVPALQAKVPSPPLRPPIA